MLFSLSTGVGYDEHLTYSDIPNDVQTVSEEKYAELHSAINNGLVVLPDLSVSPPKPSPYHVWDEEHLKWIDPRTDEEIEIDTRKQIQPITKRQFALYLLTLPHPTDDTLDMYAYVETLIKSNRLVQIEYETVKDIERLSPTVIALAEQLGWSPVEVDEMFRQAKLID